MQYILNRHVIILKEVDRLPHVCDKTFLNIFEHYAVFGVKINT